MKTIETLISIGFRIEDLGCLPIQLEGKRLNDYEIKLSKSVVHNEDETVILNIKTDFNLDDQLRALINK